MNLPNILTIMRFCLIPVYLFVFFSYSQQLAFIVVLLAGLTDILDGYIARKFGLTTQLGELLDPLADKAIMITVLISLMTVEHIHWIPGILMCLREIGMVLFGLVFYRQGMKDMPANTWGKMNSFFYYVLFGLIAMQWIPSSFANFMLVLLLLFSLLTSIRYAHHALAKIKRQTRS
jgi:cardiolipin synthase